MLARLVLAFVWIGLLAPQAWSLPRVDISGTHSPDLRAALRVSLNLPALEAADTPLDHEAQRLSELVHALGYLDGRVGIVRGSDGQDANILTMDVQAGPLYRIGSIQVIGLDSTAVPALQASIHDLITATVGAPARDDVVSQLALDIVWRARSASFAMARVDVTDLATDPISETAALTVRLTIGAPAKFGEVTFDSGGAIDPAVLYAKVPFSTGDPYSPAALDALDTALARLPLVRQSRTEVLPDADGHVAVAVTIKTHANPAVLDHRKAMGILLMVVALLIIGCRQMALAAGSSSWSRGMRLVDASIAMILIGASILLVERALAFTAVS